MIQVGGVTDSRGATPLLQCGRRVFTTAHVAEIQGLLTAHPEWPREQLATTLCRAWDWRRADGALNRWSCQALLRRLAARGAVTLPVRRRVPGARRRPVPVDDAFVPVPADVSLADLVVRPLTLPDRTRWRRLMQTYHYLGCGQRVGESVEYVATLGEHWVALLAWGGAAWKTRPRDSWIGWDAPVQARRLHLIANNTRFLILPGLTRKNLASRVLGLTLRRLSADWQTRYGHPIWLVETFVDPARFAGTCYRAAGWIPLGQTRGYGRRDAGYVSHGAPKVIFVRPLHPDARRLLAAPWAPPRAPASRGAMRMIDVNQLPLEGADGLLDALAQVPDPRRRRGIRHPVRTILALAVCAALAGARSFQGMAEWAAELSPDLLRRLGSRRRTAPSEKCFRLTLQRLDPARFDAVISAWLLRHHLMAGHALALDGKTLRGSASPTTPARHLLSAVLPDLGLVVAQQAVPTDTNEIPCVQPLLDPLPLGGTVVTADALHTHADTARYLVEQKQADYVFTVKDNQPTLKEDIETLGLEGFPPSAHGRDQGARPHRNPRDLDQR